MCWVSAAPTQQIRGTFVDQGRVAVSTDRWIRRTDRSATGSPTRPVRRSGHAGQMNVIEVSHLHKRYGDTVAVDDVSFTVERGEIFGILGPNGAGKTTTVECVEGLRHPDGGTIRVLGVDPLRDRAQVRQ